MLYTADTITNMDNSDLSNGRLPALNDDLETSLPNNNNKATFDDLDKCVENILSWESCITNFKAKIDELNKENKSLQAHLEKLNKIGSADKGIIDDLQKTVKTLQDTLKVRLDQEEKLMLLHEQLLAEQEKVKSIENEFQVETKTFKEQYKALQNKRDHDIIQIRQEMNDQFLEKETEWNDSLSYLKKEFKMECSKREDVEKEHEREVVKMKLEYEKKIALLQVQSSRLHSTCNNSNSTNNEVFRKKLQHIQEESSKEIARLKQEVSLLQFKLNAKLDFKEKRSSPQLSGIRPGILKRRR